MSDYLSPTQQSQKSARVSPRVLRTSRLALAYPRSPFGSAVGNLAGEYAGPLGGQTRRLKRHRGPHGKVGAHVRKGECAARLIGSRRGNTRMERKPSGVSGSRPFGHADSAAPRPTLPAQNARLNPGETGPPCALRKHGQRGVPLTVIHLPARAFRERPPRPEGRPASPRLPWRAAPLNRKLPYGTPGALEKRVAESGLPPCVRTVTPGRSPRRLSPKLSLLRRG